MKELSGLVHVIVFINLFNCTYIRLYKHTHTETWIIPVLCEIMVDLNSHRNLQYLSPSL